MRATQSDPGSASKVGSVRLLVVRTGMLEIRHSGASETLPGFGLADPTRAVALAPDDAVLLDSTAAAKAALTVVELPADVVAPDLLPAAVPMSPAVLFRLHESRSDLPEVVRGLERSARPFAVERWRVVRAGRTDRDAVVAAAALLIAADLGAAHSLKALARELGVSPFHLAHVFRERTGGSVHQYLLQLRVSAALERLANSDEALSRVALDLGFASHSHFTAVFRRHVGVAPSVARWRIRETTKRAVRTRF